MSVLIDTSTVIAREQGQLDRELPDGWCISTITLGELHVGALVARDETVRSLRTLTLAYIERYVDALPFDEEAARVFGQIVSRARSAGRRANAADAIIAATAIANGLTLYSCDSDFTAFPGLALVLLAPAGTG